MIKAEDGVSFRRLAITFNISVIEATALAEFLKRLDYEDCARFAAPFVSYDGLSEADTIWAAVLTLQRGLGEAGYIPR
jgi:hypothetical protein